MSERCPKHGTVIVRPSDVEPYCAMCGFGNPIATAAEPDADLDFHAWPPRPVGGQQVADLRCGVLVIHRETGIAVVVDRERSLLKNRSEAVEKLRALLAERGASEGPPPNLEGQRWRTKSGVVIVEVDRRVDGRGVKVAAVRSRTGAWHGWIHLSKLERL